jgi:hypothetical protein
MRAAVARREDAASWRRTLPASLRDFRGWGGDNPGLKPRAYRDRGEPRGSRPSHTTVRTGPYTAVRLVKRSTKSP